LSKNINTMIDDLVGTLTDPIIVYPGGWGDSLPEWLKNAITLERLTENMKTTNGEQPTGTDAEACAYLNTASLTMPLLFNLLSERYERRSTLITTNLAFGEWVQVFGDAKLTTALLYRLGHHSHILTTKGSSYRSRKRQHEETVNIAPTEKETDDG